MGYRSGDNRVWRDVQQAFVEPGIMLAAVHTFLCLLRIELNCCV